MKRFINLVFKPIINKKSDLIQICGLVLTNCYETRKLIVSIVFTWIGLKRYESKKLILTFFAIILISCRVLGQEPVKNSYSATYTYNPPVIDGLLSEEVWKEGLWCGNFTQYDPLNSKSVSQKTEFKILYDDNNIYIALVAFDTNPDSIVRRLTSRDQIEGDAVAIIFDSYHDLRTGFFFGVSVAGVKYDLVYTNDGQNQDPTWDPNWWVKTTSNNNGWVAEMKIPLDQLRFEKNSNGKWGLQVARMIYRKNEVDYWQHIGKDAPGLIHMFGELSGLEKAKPRKIFDVTPNLIYRTETYKAEKGNPFRNSGRSFCISGGIDSKIGITNNLTLDLTINPDFGQVEADPSVVNLTAFETFNIERRPFFVEGNNITDFNLGFTYSVENDNLFYSRRIGRTPQYYPTNIKNGWALDVPTFTKILGAVKLTGKTKDGLSVGFIDAITNEEEAEIDTVGGRIHQPVEPMTNYIVGRVQKDINSGNTIIGGIITNTYRVMDSTLSSVLHKTAFTGGIDLTQYFRSKSWRINFYSAFSLVEGTKDAITKTQKSSKRYYQRPDNDYVKFDTLKKSLTGSGGKLAVMKLDGHLNLTCALLWKTPGFETNDLGYVRKTDQIIGLLDASYNQWEPKGIYNRYSISCSIYNIFDFGGDNLVKAIEPGANVTFRNYWSAYLSGSITANQLSTTLLRGGPLMKIPGSYEAQYGFSSDNRKKFIMAFSYGRYGHYQKSSSSRFFNITMQFKPTKNLIISLSPKSGISDDQLQYVTVMNYNNNPRYIFAAIHQKTISASLKVNLNISPNMTLQYWGQPFFAAGKYYLYKYITNPAAMNYKDRFHIYSEGQITCNDSGYSIDEDENGKSDYQIGSSNFNYQVFLSNLVFRWEYSPGSSVDFVWSQTRNGSDDSGIMDGKLLGSLFSTKPTNSFLIKFRCRFGLK